MNTANNRASAISAGRPWTPLLPAPDTALEQADRQQAAWAYAGILASEPVVLYSFRLMDDVVLVERRRGLIETGSRRDVVRAEKRR